MHLKWRQPEILWNPEVHREGFPEGIWFDWKSKSKSHEQKLRKKYEMRKILLWVTEVVIAKICVSLRRGW